MSEERRRFLLSDAIVLVVAAALMLSADRAVGWIWSSFSAWFGDVPSWNPAVMRRMACSLALAGLSLPLLSSGDGIPSGPRTTAWGGSSASSGCSSTWASR